MKKAILLHGWEWNWKNHWFPWTQWELENRGFEVYSPNLPNTMFPVLEEHLNYIEDIVKDFTDGDIIIGHSLWGSLAMNIIEKYKLSWIKVILVWPTYQGYNKDNEKKYSDEWFKTLSAYTSNHIENTEVWNQYIICLSENDESIDLEKAEEYYCMFEDVEFLEFPNSGHFTKWDWVTQLPEILEYFE
jgi:predicted alpha/beta hydrolase family esterase